MADDGSDLPWLGTAGNRIVQVDTGTAVHLAGLNRSGLEYAEPGEAGFLAAAAFTEEDVAAIVQGWGARIIRVPFNQDWVLRGRGRWSGEDYCLALDQVIGWAARRGAYTLLDLQWLDADHPRGTNRDGTVNRVAALPTLESIVAWRLLAARYRETPAVLYDVFNEPHHPLPDDETPLLGIRDDGSLVGLDDRRVTMAAWQPWARQLVLAIRAVHPRALIFVSGVQWGYDLRGMPLPVETGSADVFGDLVYSTHVYPWSGRYGARWRARRWPRWLGAGTLSWVEAFGDLASTAPVFVSECGGGARDRQWAHHLLHYLQELGVGWAAWSWSDWPHLRAARGSSEPSEFGEVVRDALSW